MTISSLITACLAVAAASVASGAPLLDSMLPPGGGGGVKAQDVQAQTLTPRFFAEEGARRARLRYGPFVVPPRNDTATSGMKTAMLADMALPCRGCLITSFGPGLEYAVPGDNGSSNSNSSSGSSGEKEGEEANADTGMWLHHLVVANAARRDATCPEPPPVQGEGQEDGDGRRGRGFERVFAAGNERGVIDLTLNGTQRYGYPVSADDELVLFAELMNEQDGAEGRAVVVTVDWEWVPMPSAPPSASSTGTSTAAQDPAFTPATPIWLDIDGACGTFTNGSEVLVPDLSGSNFTDTAFTLSMRPPWTSDRAGAVVFVGSHLHDGGAAIRVTRNGAAVCEAVARYGGAPGYVGDGADAGMGMGTGTGMTEMEHISSMAQTCSGGGAGGFGRTEVGDAWSVTARYDFAAHPGMVDEGGGDGGNNKGKLSPIMGISLLFVASASG